MILRRLRALALLALLPMPAMAADEVSERVVRSYLRSMTIIEECGLDVPRVVFMRLLDFGRDLQQRMGVTDEEAARIKDEEAEGFDPARSTCDIDDDEVAAVLGFVQEQSVIVGVNSGLGVRDEEAIAILGGLFLSVAILEYCRIPIDTDVAALIGAHAQRLQERVAMTIERSEDIYAKTLAGIRIDAPDCDRDGEALKAPLAMIEDYRAELTRTPVNE